MERRSQSKNAKRYRVRFESSCLEDIHQCKTRTLLLMVPFLFMIWTAVLLSELIRHFSRMHLKGTLVI